MERQHTDPAPSQSRAERVKGIATKEGGLTSHAAIFARSMRIPTITGVDHLLEEVNEGDFVILDATEGSLLSLSVTPNFGELDGFTTFVIAETKGALYWTPFEGDRLTLAARGRLGVIFGDSRQNLPANKRYYSGGGGSIRGYEFQTVGPLDADDDPIGGRSVLETGIEARIRIGESFGVVPFLEGGTAFADQFLDSGEPLLWAAGLGLRYYTAVGPLRFDLAFPLNGRPRDEDFEFYVSIGQAF